MGCRDHSCKPFSVHCSGGHRCSVLGECFRTLRFAGSPPPRHCWVGTFRPSLRWGYSPKHGTWSSMRVSLLPDFFSGGPLFSLGQAFRRGPDGRSSYTCFLLRCRATFFLHTWCSAIVLFIRCTSPRHGTWACPLFRTNNARQH